jgi:hypothetical protein
VLAVGLFSDGLVEAAMNFLETFGSQAAPFSYPEGVVVYHEHAKVAFKKTFDDRHKEAA